MMEPLQKVKILLVDDRPENLLALESILDLPEYHLVKATSGEGALRAVLTQDFAVIVMDVHMPGMDGVETARVIKQRERSQHTPIIFLTATALNDQGIMQGYATGAVDYLFRPPDPLLLRSKVGVFAELYRKTDALHVANMTLEQRVAERTAALVAKDEELRSLSQQLWQAAKLATMGELAASIAHELNNPLATVTLHVESLLARIPGDSPQRETLQVIEGEIERVSNLVANLLQFSRRSQAQISSVDVREEIEKTLELIHYHLRNRRITVEREFGPGMPMIHGDRQQFRQLFLNLFSNASDAMPKGGTLTLRVRTISNGECRMANLPTPDSRPPTPDPRPPAAVVIEVADTGVGIAPEDLSRVMEPFFTTKPEGKGTGLGLPICRRVVQDHGGTLDITSQLGKGTAVRIALPVQAAAGPDLL